MVYFSLFAVLLVVKTLRPEVKVYGVQAEGAPSMYRSLHEHKYQTLKAASTFADGIQVKTPGELTYQLCEQYVDDIVTVTEDETAAAILSLMAVSYTHLGQGLRSAGGRTGRPRSCRPVRAL